MPGCTFVESFHCNSRTHVYDIQLLAVIRVVVVCVQQWHRLLLEALKNLNGYILSKFFEMYMFTISLEWEMTLSDHTLVIHVGELSGATPTYAHPCC